MSNLLSSKIIFIYYILVSYVIYCDTKNATETCNITSYKTLLPVSENNISHKKYSLLKT